MKRVVATLTLALGAATAWGDQLVLAGQEKEGTFRGFEDGRFLFQPEWGKPLKEPRTEVNRLVLARPVKASYQTADGKSVKDAVLKGYERSQFLFENATVPAIRMKKLDVVAEPAAAGEGDAGGGYPIPQVDISGMTGDLTPAQRAVLDRYQAAKKAFDDYVAASAAMVRDMDAATGARRTELLNQLRLRKNAEQPLRADLVAAFNALATAFPAPPGNAPAAGR